jgi:hypothetical protein
MPPKAAPQQGARSRRSSVDGRAIHRERPEGDAAQTSCELGFHWQFLVPKRLLAPQDTKKHHPSPAGQREQAIPGWMMVIPPVPATNIKFSASSEDSEARRYADTLNYRLGRAPFTETPASQGFGSPGVATGHLAPVMGAMPCLFRFGLVVWARLAVLRDLDDLSGRQ